MNNKVTYLFGIIIIGLILWIVFNPLSEENDNRLFQLETLNESLTIQKDSLKELAISLRAEKQLYLDSAKSMDIRLAESEHMKKRLIIGYEEILKNIADMPATEHASFYSSRYSDNDN